MFRVTGETPYRSSVQVPLGQRYGASGTRGP